MKIRTKRIEGFGKGMKMNFPTINIQLPLGKVELGLWAVLTNFGPAMGLFSNYSGMIRGEIHVFSLNYNYVNLEPGTEFDLEFVEKLRDPIRIKNIEESIKADKVLANDFWKGIKTCVDCSRCYQQDFGYSNWTVEGTNYGCYADIWEEDSDDDYFNRFLKYKAISCPHFSAGDYWELDVDGNSPGPSDDWLLALKRDIKLNNLLN